MRSRLRFSFSTASARPLFSSLAAAARRRVRISEVLRLGQPAQQVATLLTLWTGAADELSRHLPVGCDIAERLQVDAARFESRLHALDQLRVGVCGRFDVPRVLITTNWPGDDDGASQPSSCMDFLAVDRGTDVPGQ